MISSRPFKSVVSMQLSCILEFDGASRGNPGQAGAGVIVRSEDGIIVCILISFVLLAILITDFLRRL